MKMYCEIGFYFYFYTAHMKNLSLCQLTVYDFPMAIFIIAANADISMMAFS